MRHRLALCAALALAAPCLAGYKKAPPAIRKILDLPPAPTARLLPGRDALLLAYPEAYPSIDDVARPFLRLAGLRIDPVALGRHLPRRYLRLDIQPLDGGKPVAIEIPAGTRPGLPEWSPDGKRFALACVGKEGTILHVGDRATGKVRRLGVRLNGSLADPVRWMPDGKTLLCVVPGKPGATIKEPIAPVIQETSGVSAPARTYQDLLKNADDARMFSRTTLARLALVDGTGKAAPFGPPACIASALPSPDGKHVLVTRIERPYSYALPVAYFPLRIEVWDMAGKMLRRVADLPLADKIPIEGVRQGPRAVAWHPLLPAALAWAEALDGGDPRAKAARRDKVVLLASLEGQPETLMETEHRFTRLSWLEDGRALVREFERDKRRRRTWLLKAGGKPRLLFDLSTQDRYRDPGAALTKRTKAGHRVVRLDKGGFFLVGEGASPKGSRPFLDRYSLEEGKATRLFQSAADAYESVAGLLADDGSKFLTRHESPSSPPNYRVREKGKAGFIAVTRFTDPAPELRKITRKLVAYKRADGVPLSFTLFLPPGHKEGTKLPTLIWAYPREFADRSTAGQVVGSPNRFTVMRGPSPLFMLLAGYAVLDGASMPVVGPPSRANDTFVEQIASSAKAAIDKAAELGATDPDRVAVGGHSYGAFMTANLLAHSSLFRAGIARSGAYNRTLTPFGFQNEQRTYWQAPEVYLKMSPFMHAVKIKTPLLLIHGADDDNSGTFPIQSARMYQAIRGNGGTARHVVLPHEAHGYAARESVEHVLAETVGMAGQAREAEEAMSGRATRQRGRDRQGPASAAVGADLDEPAPGDHGSWAARMHGRDTQQPYDRRLRRRADGRAPAGLRVRESADPVAQQIRRMEARGLGPRG